MAYESPIFQLTLEKTYYTYGYFNVTRSHDQMVRKKEGPFILLPNGGQELLGYVHRTANRNRTARVRGNAALRDWFQEHYHLGDTVPVAFESETLLRLG